MYRVFRAFLTCAHIFLEQSPTFQKGGFNFCLRLCLSGLPPQRRAQLRLLLPFAAIFAATAAAAAAPPRSFITHNCRDYRRTVGRAAQSVSQSLSSILPP